MASSTSTFTIQPWARGSREGNELRDVLARAQRGHLRNITEASLQEEIAADGAMDLSDSESSDEEDEDDEADMGKKPVWGKPSTREDLYNMKRYMLDAVGAARNEVNVSLDLMSLIVSKEIPKQANVTLSKHVRDKVPLATMGVDFWQRMPVDKTREAQDALLAANVKMDSLQASADSLLGAAKRLENNVKKEAQYWDQLLSISSQGWSVCRVPGQRHRLGVRFGFSDSAPQFAGKGIAALNPDQDGGLRLDRGIGSKPKALHSVFRKDGRIVGTSKVPRLPDAGETTLEARIRYARDSLFDEELYHEMIRESRTLASLGITVEGSAIKLQKASPSIARDELEVSFDLISQDEENILPEDASNNQDTLAEAILLASRLLLSQAHRERLRKRSELPQPMSEKQRDDKPVLPILRPIMSLLLHRSALEQLDTYLASTASTLLAAKIDHTVQPAQLPLPTPDATATSEGLVSSTLLRPLTSSATLSISPPLSAPDAESSAPQPSLNLTAAVETSLSHSFGSIITLRPSLQEGADKSHRFNDFDTFVTAANANLASGLLTRVQREAGNEWKLRPDEAVLEKDVGVGEQEEVLYVRLDGLGGELRLMYRGGGRQYYTWTAAQKNKEVSDASEGDGAGEDGGVAGFWNVARSFLHAAT